MTLIDETKKMFSQLVKEHERLVKQNADFFEIKDIELEILRVEAQLRNFGVEF